MFLKKIDVKIILKKLLIAVFFLFSLLAPGSGFAVTVAVFPVEDLSQGRNGVNFPLTEFLQQNLSERGHEIVPSSRIISFMARYRIRWLGFLDTSHIFQVHDDLGADYLLLGSVTQLQEDPVASLGMVLTVVRSRDGRVVWTDVGAMSQADISNLLGIDEPESVADLLPVLANDLLNGWPAVKDDSRTGQRVLVESTSLSPRFVMPGEMVHCSVKIRTAAGRDDLSRVLLMVGDDDFLPMREEKKNFYTVSWVAPDRNGSLPVSLILHYHTGDKEVFFAGNYQIDNRAPKLTLNIKGKKVNNHTAFSRRLIIQPLWQDPEPISRWSLTVRNLDGDVMIAGEGKRTLPKRFFWKGQRPDGHKAYDGIYDVVLQVWDRAGNVTAASEKVLLTSTPPIPRVTAEIGAENLVVSLDGDSEIPVDFWTSEILFSDGEVVLVDQGSELPVELQVPYPLLEEKRKLECVVVIRDVLGNRIRKKIKDLMQYVAPTDEKEEAPKHEEWVTEF